VCRILVGKSEEKTCEIICTWEDNVNINLKGINWYNGGVRGHAVAWLVEALCYKPEGRGIESR
jgi:hypothetical protein